MRRLILAALMLCASAGLAFAQTPERFETYLSLQPQETTLGTGDTFMVLHNGAVYQATIPSVATAPLSTQIVTSASTVTGALSDGLIIVNKTVGSATTYNAVASPTAGQQVCIKDGKGDANVNNITFTPPTPTTVDGQTTYVISMPYQSNCFVYNGTQWNVM